MISNDYWNTYEVFGRNNMKISSEQKLKILNFFKSHKLCVVSTIHTNANSPESAVVAFTENEDLEIIFGTSNKSRKYKNIQNNNKVSFVIGWDSETGSIQYEGEAVELSKEDSTQYINKQIIKNASSEKYVEREDQRYFKVSPNWIRFIDNTANPPQTYEIDI